MSSNPQDYPIPSNSYVNFDGDSIKEVIRQRLNQTGIFTDQNYEGSNLSHWNEIISYVFSMLFYYINKQSNEGSFTEAQLYENINKVVKQLDYRPVGYQTATLSFEASASNLSPGLYTIPRYSFIEVGGISYSFNEDITFAKTTNNLEVLSDMSREKLLYQGRFIEHPIIQSTGNENEIIFLTVDDNTNIDHFNIDVYVKDNISGKWVEWEQTTSLYLNRSNEYKYELRLNENKRYELKFGNNINGRKLNQNDQIAIYYLKSSGSSGEVGANTLNGKTLTFFQSNRMSEILTDISTKSSNTFNPKTSLAFSNTCVSSNFSELESIESIRENAPGIFRSQFRVVTANDYETFLKTNFSNLIQDVKVFNNSKYLNKYLKYFGDLGLVDSNLESRALFNQVNFADSCNFNNVYLFVVPKTVGNNLSYVNPAQKELIIDTIREEKVLTSETVLLDPVYVSFDFALGDNTSTKISSRDNTRILIEKTGTSRRTDDSIKEDILTKIQTYFSRKNLKLGQILDLNQLTSDILSIDGVRKIFTYRTDTGSRVEGLRLISWNPAYGDISMEPVVTNITLEDFQFPFLAEDLDLATKIVIESKNSNYEGAEY